MTLSPQKIAAITRAKHKREIERLERRVTHLTAAMILASAYFDSIANRYEGITEFDNAREAVDIALKDKTCA